MAQLPLDTIEERSPALVSPLCPVLHGSVHWRRITNDELGRLKSHLVSHVMHRIPTLALLPTVLLLSASACARDQAAGRVAGREAPVVAVVKAATEDLSRELVLTAEFRPFQEVDVMAKVAGYVKNINVDVGDRVKQGQLLAVLEIPEMVDERMSAQASVDRAQAEVKRAQDQVQQALSAYDIAHVTYTRLAEVAKQRPGLVAQQEIDEAHGKDLVADAQVSGARSNLAAAEEQVRVNTAELQKASTLLAYSRVVAPFTGVVTKRYADTGSMIQAGTTSSVQAMPLVRLSQNNLLRLTLPVPESAVPTVHLGQQVQARVPTLDRTFPGRVARFSDNVSLATRTMETEVDVPNPDLVLVPGMYAEVHLTLDRRSQVITIPISAVDVGADPSSGHVAVVTVDHRVDIRQVQLGMETATKAEIRSGLSDGDQVIVGNRSGLQQGQTVRSKVTSTSAATPGGE
jgi:RND family efflux transporter MFP subunit